MKQIPNARSLKLSRHFQLTVLKFLKQYAKKQTKITNETKNKTIKKNQTNQRKKKTERKPNNTEQNHL